MALTFLEVDSCSGTPVPRRIPDDYTMTMRPQSTDFGSRGDRRFEVRSIGLAPLNVRSVELEPADAEFTLELVDATEVPLSLPVQILPNANRNVPPGLVIRVGYTAQDAEADSVELVIKTDDENRSEVRFNLTAGKGKLEVCATTGCGEGAAVQFGNVSRGSSATETITIRNTGDGDLDLRSLILTSDSAEFCAPEATEIPEGVTDCTLLPKCLVLGPGEEYTINVSYLPVDGGEDTGLITIVSGDAAAGNIEVPINGTGAGPAVCVCTPDGAGDCTPAPFVDFGAAEVGGSVDRTVRLVSCGTDPMEITAAVLESDSNNPFFTGPEFTISTAFNTGTFMPGEFSEGVITYSPTAGGMHRGGLRYEQPNLPSWVALQGSAATCDLEPFPSSLNFGTVAGGSFADRQVAMINNGARDCNITAIGMPSDPNFTIEMPPALPAAVAPGQQVLVTVRFTAPVGMVTGYAGTMVVTSDEPAPNADNTIDLSAQGGGTPQCAVRVTPSGNDNPLTMRDGRLEFGAVNIGYDKVLPLRVENIGNTECVLQSYNLVTQAPTEFAVVNMPATPASISPGANVTIDVRFAPTGPASTLTGIYGGFLNHLDFTLAGPGLMQTAWEISISARPTEPTIDVLPPNVDFGVVTWENPQAPDNRSSCGSVTRSVNVYNSGTGQLTVTGVSIDAASDPVFLVTDVVRGGASLPQPYQNILLGPGENIEVRLRFFPSRDTPPQHQGLLIIDNDVTNLNGMGAPLTVPLAGESTTNSQQTDVFNQLSDNKVDILWAVDDSGSMSEEQNLLAQNFGSFIAFADTLGVDYQIGVTTTEVNDGVSGHLWACNGFNKIIRSSDANRVQAFQCAANVTNPPSGNSRPNPGGSDEQEAGLQAARIALDVPVVDNENAGFLRPDARLAVITVSDEEDQSDGPVNLYIDFFRNIKGFRNPQLVSLSAIGGNVPGGCATADEGRRYFDAAAALNGQFESICTQSWQTMLQSIGLDVFTLRQAWGLSRPADPNTLTVRVNGVSIAQNSNDGWSFDTASNTVTFHGTEVPPPGATIEIQYGTLCLP